MTPHWCIYLWLAEALLQNERLQEARELVENVRSFLREAPNLLVWGLMMRMVAKIEAADGHLAAAIQSLAQLLEKSPAANIEHLRPNIEALVKVVCILILPFLSLSD